jgi:predicted N-acyltransferase
MKKNADRTNRQKNPGELNIQVFNTINDIGRNPIDALSDDAFFTYGWFKTLEQQPDFCLHPFYICIYDNSELVAFAPCFIDELDEYFIHGLFSFPFMKKILNVGNKLGLWKKHIMICYSQSCYRSKILINGKYSKKEILCLINKTINDICKKERILFSSFPFVSEQDTCLLTSLSSFGYFQYPWINTLYVDVCWANFDDYLASFSHKVRNNISREIRSFSESEIKIEEPLDFGNISEKMADLSSNLFEKYNPGEKTNKNEAFFKSLNENAKDITKLIIAKKEDNLVGYLLLMRQKDNLDCFTCGFDYNLLSNTTFLYFNMVYYYPIKWAIQEGISKIYYRRTAEEAKLHRGCNPEQIFTNLKCQNKLLDLLFYLYINQKYSRFMKLIGQVAKLL